KSMDSDPEALSNLPVGTVAEVIKEFLIRNSFAVSHAGEPIISSRGIALKNAGSIRKFQKMMQTPHDYLVIDDDKFNNLLCTTIIQSVSPSVDIKTFSDPNIGLRHIQAQYGSREANDVILLLDINMPTLLGWEVLDEFKNLSDVTRDHVKTFMLTSSIDP